jgi:predicted glycogen debranching enzyme
MIKFEKEICTDFQKSSSLEWLETNGIGGFASSTVSGANTRRYHGLLIAATRPPLGRILMISKFEEVLTIDGETFELSANQYPDVIHPNGFQYLKSFRQDPFPIWTFETGGIEIEKKIFMPHGSNTTVCQWSASGNEKSEISLELKPLIAFRDYHHLKHIEGNFDSHFEFNDKQIAICPFQEMPALIFSHNAGSTEKTLHWYRNFEYEIERQRGFDFREDLFQPFTLKFDLSETAIVIASTESQNVSDVKKLEKAEIERRENLCEVAEAKDDFTKQLVLAADQYIVKRGTGETIIAGYPWFSDWGRDTMISLTGLTLATNRDEIARNIIREFSNHISEGMLPNRFPDEDEEPEYNTVDATLWYFEAIRAYAEKTGDFDFVKDELYEKLKGIIEWHLQGTRYNIHAELDNVLYAGEEGVQLTWMDAKVGDWVVTPRIGKPVEIQALWYNALKIMEDFAERFGDKEGKKHYQSIAEYAKKSFNKIFWNEDAECLFDVINGEEKDGSIRPNQIFAVSLPHTMLSSAKAKKVLQKVEKELLTPFGLRSLSPNDIEYRPIYIGNTFERDSAYHQGTVWAWLIGAYIDAYRKISPKTQKSEKYISQVLEGFKAHLKDKGIGQISEIFDADSPHEPRGCFAQAWSVAEILRVLKTA